jgi:hypothetical protein
MNLGPSAVWVSSEELSTWVKYEKGPEAVVSKAGEVRTLHKKTEDPTLSTMFGELQVYEPPSPPDVLNRQLHIRPDEPNAAPIPVSRFFDSQPILLSLLQPSLRMYNSIWHNFNDAPVTAQEGQRAVGHSGKIRSAFLFSI